MGQLADGHHLIWRFNSTNRLVNRRWYFGRSWGSLDSHIDARTTSSSKMSLHSDAGHPMRSAWPSLITFVETYWARQSKQKEWAQGLTKNRSVGLISSSIQTPHPPDEPKSDGKPPLYVWGSMIFASSNRSDNLFSKNLFKNFSWSHLKWFKSILSWLVPIESSERMVWILFISSIIRFITWSTGSCSYLNGTERGLLGSSDVKENTYVKFNKECLTWLTSPWKVDIITHLLRSRGKVVQTLGFKEHVLPSVIATENGNHHLKLSRVRVYVWQVIIESDLD